MLNHELRSLSMEQNHDLIVLNIKNNVLNQRHHPHYKVEEIVHYKLIYVLPLHVVDDVLTCVPMGIDATLS